MKIKNLSISKIIDIINKMNYSKVKHAKHHYYCPLEITICSKEYELWEYEVFFEDKLFDAEWDIISLRLNLINQEFFEYDQDRFISLSIKDKLIELYYTDRTKNTKTLIKSFKRDINKLKEFLKTKMKEEVIKTQKRKSYNKKKDSEDVEKFVNTIEMTV